MSEPIKKEDAAVLPEDGDKSRLRTRREFLQSVGKWSAVIIGGAAIGGIAAPTDAGAWVNGGGGWVNARGGGGGAWVNRAGGGGAGWVNRAGGGAWVNNRGGGGAWVNRY